MRKAFEFADAERERRSATVDEGRAVVAVRKQLQRSGARCSRCRTEPATAIDSTTRRACCEGCARIERDDREIAAVRRSRRVAEIAQEVR